MGSIYDLIQRTDHLVKKYEKYDAPIKTTSKSDDPFQEELDAVEEEVEKLMEVAGDVALEANRAVAAAKNAEIRRAKNVLLSEAVAALEKKVKKGKGVSKALIEDRQNKIKAIIDKIYAVPDGMSLASNRRPTRVGAKGTKNDPIILDNNKFNGGTNNTGWYDHTEQTQGFQKEWETRRDKQDVVLTRIEAGVVELGEIARGVQEELDQQAPTLDDIETQMDKVTKQLKTNNVKLKGLVTKMRSSRNFCVDVILIVLLLGVGAYIFAMVTGK